jgi:hypothetical protein
MTVGREPLGCVTRAEEAAVSATGKEIACPAREDVPVVAAK